MERERKSEKGFENINNGARGRDLLSLRLKGAEWRVRPSAQAQTRRAIRPSIVPEQTGEKAEWSAPEPEWQARIGCGLSAVVLRSEAGAKTSALRMRGEFFGKRLNTTRNYSPVGHSTNHEDLVTETLVRSNQRGTFNLFVI